MHIDYSSLFQAYDRVTEENARKASEQRVTRNALQAFLYSSSGAKASSGFQRMKLCRCVMINY